MNRIIPFLSVSLLSVFFYIADLRTLAFCILALFIPGWSVVCLLFELLLFGEKDMKEIDVNKCKSLLASDFMTQDASSDHAAGVGLYRQEVPYINLDV
jgi:hypothetical protein